LSAAFECPLSGQSRHPAALIAVRLWAYLLCRLIDVTAVLPPIGKGLFMSVEQLENEERPCLYCLMVDLIDDYFAEYKATSREEDAIDTDEAIVAIAKTVTELTSNQDGTVRQKIIEQLMREIIEYDAEFRKENETGSSARH
jgi:hypothetical protein